MNDVTFWAKAIYRGLWAVMEATAAMDGRPAEPVRPTAPVCCVRCGAEPFLVQWGAIRLGQDLSGFYYQATLGEYPDLLCQNCWDESIGMSPRRPT